MKNVYILCEGQTEESFVNAILYDFFLPLNIQVVPIVLETKRTSTQKHKGGVSKYSKIKKELSNLCKSHRHEYITTLIDYYGLPDDTPGVENKSEDIYQHVKNIEASVDGDVGFNNCRFHLMLHEFEGLLFSHPNSFGCIADKKAVDELQRIRDAFDSPELINCSRETAPSKRIVSIIPEYTKIRSGTIVAKDIGINCMMEQCQHFHDWIQMIVGW